MWQLLEVRNPNIRVFEDIEFHIIEMPKISKYPKATEKSLSAWIEFLSNPESELVKMSKKEDEELNDAYEKLQYISGDERLRRLAELRWKYELDQNSMINGSFKEGLAEGREERRKNWRSTR